MLLAAEYIPSLLLQLTRMLGRYSGIGNRTPRFPVFGGDFKLPTPDSDRLAGNRESARGIGNRESGIGNRESGIGNRETGNGKRAVSRFGREPGIGAHGAACRGFPGLRFRIRGSGLSEKRLS
jgi:hypothetical protein